MLRQLPPTRLEAVGALARALGVAPGDATLSLDELFSYAADEVAGLFDVERNTLELDERALSLAPSQLLALLVHELTHAAQAQRGDFAGPWSAMPTHDVALARLCEIEGEASAAMLLVAREHESLAGIGRATRLSIEKALAHSMATPYFAGAHFYATRADRPGKRPHWRCASTEQALHAEHLGFDPPRIVPLEAPRGEVIHTDTLGELQVLQMLYRAGLGRLEASLAACGWGGDSLRVERTADGGERVLWVTEWDSEADAMEFEEALRVHGADSIRRTGDRVWLDTASDAPAAIEAASVATRARTPRPPGVLLAEASLRAAYADELSSSGKAWTDSVSGLRIPHDAAWLGVDNETLRSLLRPLPHVSGSAVLQVTVESYCGEQFSTQTIAGLEAWAEPGSLQFFVRDGFPAATFEAPMPFDPLEPVRGRVLMILRPDELIHVYAAAPARAWPCVREQIAAMLEQARFELAH